MPPRTAGQAGGLVSIPEEAVVFFLGGFRWVLLAGWAPRTDVRGDRITSIYEPNKGHLEGKRCPT